MTIDRTCHKANVLHVYLDETVQLLITTNGQLKMSGCDTLHLQQPR